MGYRLSSRCKLAVKTFKSFLFSYKIMYCWVVPVILAAIKAVVLNIICFLNRKFRHQIAEEENISKYGVVKRRTIIKDAIKVRTENILLIWSPTQSLRPDIVATVIGRFDLNVEIQESSLPLFSSKRRTDFGSIVAKFTTVDAARKASKELSILSNNSVMSLQLNRLLNCLLIAEAQHSDFGKDFTRIQICAKQCFTEKRDKARLVTLLNSFGDVRNISFRDHQCRFENGRHVISTATYAFASQAYLAKIYLDGLFHKRAVRFLVNVEETLKVKDLMRLLRLRIIDLQDAGRYVHT